MLFEPERNEKSLTVRPINEHSGTVTYIVLHVK